MGQGLAPLMRHFYGRRWPTVQRNFQAKYANTKTQLDGITFHSKGEAELYALLMLQKKIGDVAYFLRQVPFHLPGGVIYRIDFLVFYIAGPHAGRVRYLDFKGFETRDFINKKKQVEALYPVVVELVRKSRGRFLGL